MQISTLGFEFNLTEFTEATDSSGSDKEPAPSSSPQVSAICCERKTFFNFFFRMRLNVRELNFRAINVVGNEDVLLVQRDYL